MKYLLVMLFLLTGCGILDECKPGDSEACLCGSASYINYCTMDGYYMDCECYQNNGQPITQTQADYYESQTGTATGGDQNALNELYVDAPEGNCEDGEVGIPGTTSCLRICPVGMDWVGDECIGVPYFQTYQFVKDECQKYHPDYRLINMDEMAYLLKECYPSTFSYASTNYCSPYLESPFRYAMKMYTDSPSFSTWVGELVVCDDAYGTIGENCSWSTNLYTKNYLSTEFNFLRANAQYGSAASGGICVR